MTLIKNLAIAENIHVDQNRMAEFRVRLGSKGAEAFFAKSMQDIAVDLAKIHRAYGFGRLNEVQFVAGKIETISSHIGMVTLANVAADVRQLAVSTDSTALSSTVARLSRIGEHSLTVVWTARNLSI